MFLVNESIRIREYIQVLPAAEPSLPTRTTSSPDCESPLWEGNLRRWSVTQGLSEKTMCIVLLRPTFPALPSLQTWLITVSSKFAEAWTLYSFEIPSTITQFPRTGVEYCWILGHNVVCLPTQFPILLWNQIYSRLNVFLFTCWSSVFPPEWPSKLCLQHQSSPLLDVPDVSTLLPYTSSQGLWATRSGFSHRAPHSQD